MNANDDISGVTRRGRMRRNAMAVETEDTRAEIAEEKVDVSPASSEIKARMHAR